MDEKHKRQPINELDWHDAVDLASGVVDIATGGVGGAIIDVLHGMAYFMEYKDTKRQPDKSILFLQMCITFGSVLLPMAMQALGPVLKRAVKGAGKGIKPEPAVLKKVKPIVGKVMAMMKSVRNIKAKDEAEEWIEKVKKVATKKEDFLGYMYLIAMGAMIKVDADTVLKLPNSTAESAYEFVQAFKEEEPKMKKLA